MPHVRSVSIGVWLARGSRHEPQEQSGIAHFVEHMPHPERACEMALGSADGLILFESVVKAVAQGAFAIAR